MNYHTMTSAPIPGDDYLGKNINGHLCSKIIEQVELKDVGCWGAAVDECWEGEDGTFVVDNGEYANRVNYCPFCGAKAPTQI